MPVRYFTAIYFYYERIFEYYYASIYTYNQLIEYYLKTVCESVR